MKQIVSDLRLSARRCQSRTFGMELLDLVQEGNIGLLKAIELHQADRDPEFLGFASIYIRRALWQALVDKNRMIRLPENIVIPLQRIHRAENRLLSVLGCEPSLKEVAEEVGLSEAMVTELLATESQCSRVESLQGLLFEEDAEDKHDFVSLFTEAIVVDQAHQASLEQAVQQAIATLPRRQQRVISLRYGLDGQELNNPDTAVVMETTLKAVDAAGCRARGRLRGLLAPLYEFSQDEEVA
jgi:RNA polymerase primary sigma factor